MTTAIVPAPRDKDEQSGGSVYETSGSAELNLIVLRRPTAIHRADPF
jgi:hypothetical protein